MLASSLSHLVDKVIRSANESAERAAADTVVIYVPAVVRQLNAGLARYIQPRDKVYLAVDSDPARPDVWSHAPGCPSVCPSVRLFPPAGADVASNVVNVPVMSIYDNLTRSVDGDALPSSPDTRTHHNERLMPSNLCLIGTAKVTGGCGHNYKTRH